MCRWVLGPLGGGGGGVGGTSPDHSSSHAFSAEAPAWTMTCVGCHDDEIETGINNSHSAHSLTCELTCHYASSCGGGGRRGRRGRGKGPPGRHQEMSISGAGFRNRWPNMWLEVRGAFCSFLGSSRESSGLLEKVPGACGGTRKHRELMQGAQRHTAWPQRRRGAGVSS